MKKEEGQRVEGREAKLEHRREYMRRYRARHRDRINLLEREREARRRGDAPARERFSDAELQQMRDDVYLTWRAYLLTYPRLRLSDVPRGFRYPSH